MTTIATDGISMAGDGRISEGDMISREDYEKVRRLKDGRIVGFTGNAYNWDAYAAWLEDGGDVPKVEDQFGCIVLTPEGQVLTYDEHGRSFLESAPYAGGSGGRFALAAMDLGCSPEEAVQLAIKRDLFSGGKVTVISRPRKLRRVA